MPVWAIRFALAVLAGAGGVCAVTLAVFGSPLAHAAPVTALYLLLCGTVAVFMRGSYPHAAIGLCNLVTLARLALTVALVAPILGGGGAPHWAVFAVALLALGLDGLDGWFARRQGLASAFGARFDMEVDAGLSLILALNALVADSAGPLVLLLGLPRYAFALAGLALPWLAQPLPERFGRKLACVLQIGALVALQAPVLPPALAGLAVAVAAVALAVSFGRDLRWLHGRRVA
ncbi:CDP-alcohol phosphatidyltransferase family protein [Roseovarius sp. D22-M7]|uniref:CDP-alcohol phosphatidyltransferase family protein n=1 Tax=Roseovarius sp. D22-M7 TaxID=3127116 RepID=UPI0030103C73